MNKDGCHNDKCIGFSPYATEKKNCSVTWDNDPQAECEKYQAGSEAGSAEFELLSVERNYCNCHPETCSCDDWRLMYDGEDLARNHDKAKLEKLIEIVRNI